MSHLSVGPGFTTEGLAAVYSPESTVGAILEFEAALALALGDAGVAPRDEAERVAEACRRGISDPEQVLTSTWETGTPIIALRDQLDAGEWFHHGATTQDAIDTGQMLQARAALGLITQELVDVAGRLRALTVEFRDQPQMGRTFLQDARPTTFGFRTATWLDAVLGHLDELRGQSEGLVIQFGGPVGTLGTLEGDGLEVTTALADRLSLAVPDIGWHTNRTRILALGQAVERTAVSMAKIGTDIAYLASSAVAEVSVRSGGSSSMPEKRNPIDPMRANAAASACAGAVVMLSSAHHELDRGIGGWHVETLALPLAMQGCGAAVESIRRCLDSLEVDRETMSANAGEVGDPSGDHQIETVLARFESQVSR